MGVFYSAVCAVKGLSTPWFVGLRVSWPLKCCVQKKVTLIWPVLISPHAFPPTIKYKEEIFPFLFLLSDMFYFFFLVLKPNLRLFPQLSCQSFPVSMEKISIKGKMETIQKVCLLLCCAELWSSPTRLKYFKCWGNAFEHQRLSFEARISLIVSSWDTKRWASFLIDKAIKQNLKGKRQQTCSCRYLQGPRAEVTCVWSVLFLWKLSLHQQWSSKIRWLLLS